MLDQDEAAAIQTIRDAAAMDPEAFDWVRVVQAGYALTQRFHEQTRELERERARGYWPVQAGGPFATENKSRAGRIAMDDALSILRHGMDLDADASDAGARRELIASATAMVTYIEEREERIERERARVERAARPGAPRLDGHPMIAKQERSGRRDYVGGQPVHAGDQLLMLTWRGWLPVRYESDGGRKAVICFSLPGVDEEVSIPGPARALYVWPDELKAE